MICNLSEAALHLGYRSRSTLQRLVRDGHLEAYRVPGSTRQVLLETDPPGRPSLRRAVQALIQIRYDALYGGMSAARTCRRPAGGAER